MDNKKIHSLIIGSLLLPAAAAAEDMINLDEITVTGTREQTVKKQTPATVNRLSRKTIEELEPAHPAEATNRLPGVYVSVTNGEGHTTAIRQPLSTSPLYLYLEDGIPTRSTGFFNHNALYEVNIPQAEGIEIFKGPGTALYGSDAIGGVINILTRPAPLQAEGSVNIEAGEYGWRRLLVDGGNSFANEGLRADLNLTHSDGWRDATNYDRQSGTLRWDSLLNNGGTLKTVLATSNIDQQTAGSSRLTEDDYLHHPTLNYTPISYREVSAVRLSTAYEKENKDSLLSVTPYYRDNRMEYMPNWSFTYDPKISHSSNQSFGMLLKYRKDFAPYQTRLVAGVDVDYSPGHIRETSIDAVRSGNIYTQYTESTTIYDYDVSFLGLSPYLHLESSPTQRLRLTAGLRYDNIEYDYDNHLADGLLVVNPTSTSFPVQYNHPADSKVDYSHLSPKLGMTYQFSSRLNGFAAYRHAFRAPSEGQLFRPGRAANSLALKPVKVDSYEVGLRGTLSNGLHYEASLYRMIKADDILTYQYPDNSREVMNAGETSHTGLELGFRAPLSPTIKLGISASYAKHVYEHWQPNASTDYSGNEMESAPRVISHTRLEYRPAYLQGGRMELEWEHLGAYWMDQANTTRYDGHDLLHFRASYQLSKKWQADLRVRNLGNERYATSAAYSSSQRQFAPGMPTTVYAGVKYHFW